MDIYRDLTGRPEIGAPILRKGEVYLFGEITEVMAGEVVRKLNEYRPEELTIYVSTNGGILSAGLAIHDALLQVPKTTVITSGMCASTGTLILLAGKFRTSRPNTQFIVHDAELEPTTEGADQEEVVKHLAHLNKIVDNLFERRIGKIYASAKETGIFGAETALKFKLVDRIE